MAKEQGDRVTAEDAARLRVRLWWSMMGKLAAEEGKAVTPDAELIDRLRAVEDRLQLAITARGDMGHEEPRPKKGKSAGPRLGKYKFVG